MILRLLSRSKQPGPNVSTHIDRASFRPGEQVVVELTWRDQGSNSPTDFSFDLVCLETFWYTVKATGAAWVGNYPGHREENYAGPPYTAAGRPGRYETSKELTRLPGYMTLDDRFPKQDFVRGTAKFQLPADAQPTVRGDTASVKWELQAGVGSPTLARSSLGEIKVLSNRGNNVGGLESYHQPESTPLPAGEQRGLRLSLPEHPLIAGQTLEGMLIAKPPGDTAVTKVHAELVCWEKAGAKQSSAVFSKAVLQGRSILDAGQEYQWPFQLQVPHRLLPSTTVGETSVVWRVKGVLGRRLRTQLEVFGQVQVTTGD